jgi:hypothetical protein
MRGKAEETARTSQLSLPGIQSGALRGVPLFVFPLIPEVTFLQSILLQRFSNCSLFGQLARFTPR